MARIHRLYEQLRSITDVSVDLAMSAALPTADALAARLIALMLLQRKHPDGLRTLVLHFDSLPPDIQGVVVRRADELYRSLREAAANQEGRGPANVLKIIRRAGSTRLAYLAAAQLHHGPAELRAEAAECLLDLAGRVATGPFDGRSTRRPSTGEVPAGASLGIQFAAEPGGGPAPCTAESAAYLQKTVEQAVVQYRSHEQPLILKAMALLCPRPMMQVVAALEDWHNPLHEALRRALARADQVEFRCATLALAVAPALKNTLAEAVDRSIKAGHADDLLEHWHLLLLPVVRKMVDGLGNIDHAYLNDGQVDRWPAHRARGLPTWILALPIGTGRRLESLARLGDHPDKMVRFAALHRLIDWAESAARSQVLLPAPMGAPSPFTLSSMSPAVAAASQAALPQPASASAGTHAAINIVIESFCSDAEPALARLALRHLVRCRWPALPKLLLHLVNGDQPAIRQLAGDYLAPLGFDRYWRSWPQLDEARRIAAGRALIKIDACFHRHLSDRLSQPNRESRLRALAMIHDLNQGAFFEEALLTLIRQDDAHIVSASVMALGSAGGEKVIAALDDMLEHRDSRVRANAVEALQQLQSTQHAERLAAMAVDEDNRPRANAIGHLLELSSGQAMQALRFMLGDDRTAHRTSALWLVETAGLIEVARHVAEMSVSDDDDQVRRRAGRVIQQLIKAMKTPTVNDQPAGALPASPKAKAS